MASVKEFMDGGHLLPVGRIEVLFEAAGKTRVIAMLDGVRQTLLKPLHDAMFKRIQAMFGECCSIFDQTNSVRSFASKANLKVYSYDISAATDSICWKLYIPMMQYLLGSEGATLWLHMLKGHGFYLLHDDTLLPRVKRYVKGTIVHYNNGQPMGGYSSFAALDLFHHLMVQFSAFEAGFSSLEAPYTNYRVLGDDVVIGDEMVAKSYSYFAKCWSIPIKETKSIISKKGVFQYLSEFFKKEVCLSPLTLKNDFQSISFAKRMEFAQKAIKRGWSTRSGFFGHLRFLLNKDKYVEAIENVVGRKKAGSLAYSMLYALAVLIRDPESWDIGEWIHNVVSHNPIPQLLEQERDFTDLQKSFVIAILRKLVWDEHQRLNALYNAESGVIQTREFLNFNKKEFHVDINVHITGLWTIKRQGAELLKEVGTDAASLNKMFNYLLEGGMYIPKLSRPGVSHPLDYLVMERVAEGVRHRKEVSSWKMDSLEYSEAIRMQILDKIFTMLKEDPYYLQVLNGQSSPYDWITPVSEEERTSGNS
jgi:hypothetical protein